MKKTAKWMMAGVALAVGVQADVVWDQNFIDSPVWNDSFDGASLNANWTAFTQGAGAGSSQAGGQLVMDTGSETGSAQAAVNTTKDETGTMSTFNGSKLYNFYDHQVKARFDIASISGANGSGRNVFYFSIGDDAAGNHMPQNTVLDNGIGFTLEQVTATPYWRLMYLPLNNASAGGGVVANISGVPTSLTYTLEGTQATIQMEGATITAVGGFGSGTVGGTGLTVALADLSANISGYTMAFGAYNLGAVTEKTVVTLDAVTVGVGGGVGAGWTEKNNGSGANSSVVDGKLVLDTGVAAGSAYAQRSATVGSGGQSTFNGAQLYDFYNHAVTARFDIDSIDGDTNTGNARNVFYCTIGEDADGVYMPQDTLLDNGVGISLEQLNATTTNAYWRFLVTTMTNAAMIGGQIAGDISQLPSAVSITFNGTSVVIEMEGAVVTAPGAIGAAPVGGTTISVETPDISGSMGTYHLAYGARNRGTVLEKTVAGLDSVYVAVEAQSFSTWASIWGVDLGSETDDYDGDGVSNLAEYALGGDPTNSADRGQASVALDGAGLAYVHAQRNDDANLSYWLETTDNLVYGTWTNAGYSVVATNVAGGAFDHVTNTIPTGANSTYVRLRIQNMP